MSEKQAVIDVVQTLPEDSSIEDILEEIEALALIRRGLSDLDEGRVVAHEQARERLEEWLSS